MSSSEPRPNRFGAMPMLLAAMALAACTVQPLHAPGPTGQLPTALQNIAVDQVDTRIAQEVRNRLLFNLYGGGEPGASAYRLRLAVTSAENALGVTPVQSSPAYAITVTTTYELTEAATGEIVLRATSRQSASYDRVNQIFANTRAKLDAENRAAVLAADDIHVRLASAAAQGTI